MNEDSYKIVISISHHRVTFAYWQRDGENKLVPIPGWNWPAPLAFYCSPSGIKLGEEAARAVASGMQGAYDRYFEHLPENIRYTIVGHEREFKNLLLDAAETVFTTFFRDTLLNGQGSLNDNRAKMPLIIACESDIAPNEKAFLYTLFVNSGYHRVKVVKYDDYIGRYISDTLSRDHQCPKVLVAWSEGQDLTYTFYNLTQSNDNNRHQMTYQGLGVDPRLDYVSNLIWDQIKHHNQWLVFDDDKEVITRAASSFLNSSNPLINSSLLLSDGNTYYYSLNRQEVSVFSVGGENSITHRLNQFLKNINENNRSEIILLLRGVAAGNEYFENNLSGGFKGVIVSDKNLRENVMRLLLNESIPVVNIPNVEVEGAPTIDVSSPPAITPTSPQIEKKVSSGSGDLTSTDKDPVPSVSPAPPASNKAIERKWKEVKATVKGKIRSANYESAKSTLDSFVKEVSGMVGIDDVLREAKLLSDEIDEATAPDSNKVKTIKHEWEREVRPVVKGKIRANLSDAADKMLGDFINKIAGVNGVDEILKEAQDLRNSLEKSKLPEKPKSTQSGKVNPKSGDARAKSSKTVNDPPKSSVNEGEKLLKKGLLKEARDWFKANNNTIMSDRLSKIIRDRKSVELRKKSLDAYKKNKNIDQIKRICSELTEYIDLCDKASVDSTEFVKLKNEYSKLLK